jgi:hypothetical protein
MHRPPSDYYGPWGATAPGGDVFVETREWRDWIFEQRASERRSPYPSWYSTIAGRTNNLIQQGMFPGMGGGGMGQMALNQLLVTMDGIDNPPMFKRFWTNRINSFLDAIYVVPRRVNGNWGRMYGAALAIFATLMLVNDLVNLGGSPAVHFLVGHSTFSKTAYIIIDVLLVIGGIEAFRNSVKKGTLSLRLPKAKPHGAQIYFIGATNVPIDRLDPALIRPGRMGRHVWFRTPTKEDRKDIFDLYLGKVAHDPELDTEARRDEIARITGGYSPAQIDQICSMALSTAHHEGRVAFQWEDLIDAMTVVEAGQAIGTEQTPDDLRSTAIHEAGHASMSHLYEPKMEQSRLSVKIRGGSLGHLSTREKEESFKEWQSDLRGRLIMLFGAMAAEHEFFGENAGGVRGDLGMATNAANAMVEYYGMAPEIPDPHGKSFAGEGEDDTIRRIQLRFQDIGNRLLSARGGEVELRGEKRTYAAQFLGEAYATAFNAVRLNRPSLEKITETLLERKEIMGDALLNLLDEQKMQVPENIDWTNEESWPKLVLWSKYKADDDKDDKKPVTRRRSSTA